MHWTLWSTWIVGCSWLAGSSEPATPKLAMKDVESELARHEGETVEVSGRYYALTVGDEWLKVTVIENPGEKTGLDCVTKDGTQFRGMARDEELVVRGPVARRHGELVLMPCERVRP